MTVNSTTAVDGHEKRSEGNKHRKLFHALSCCALVVDGGGGIQMGGIRQSELRYSFTSTVKEATEGLSERLMWGSCCFSTYRVIELMITPVK